MKKYFTSIILSLFITFSFINTGYALSPTLTIKPTEKDATPTTTSAEIEKIEKIKEMVASKVAELKLVEKRGVFGKVNDISSNTQVTIIDENGTTRIIDIDELTKFQKSDSKTFGISDLKKGDLLSIVGLYNKDTKRVLARFVISKNSLPIQFEGIIAEIDKKEYTLKVIDEAGVAKTVEIQTSTKNRSFGKTQGFVKSGFSKIEIGQRAIVTGYYDLKNKDLISADRFIHFIDVPPSSEMSRYASVIISVSPTPRITE